VWLRGKLVDELYIERDPDRRRSAVGEQAVVMPTAAPKAGAGASESDSWHDHHVPRADGDRRSVERGREKTGSISHQLARRRRRELELAARTKSRPEHRLGRREHGRVEPCKRKFIGKRGVERHALRA
jgi:hypothetical protein